MIDEIVHNNEILAIHISHKFSSEGIKFFTPDEFPQQIGYMNRPKGYSIDPHIHNKIERKINYSTEVLFIKSGLVKINFYDNEKNFIETRRLYAGDIILLVSGGHGFEMLENSEIYEIKQGPYVGEKDKSRFKPEK